MNQTRSSSHDRSGRPIRGNQIAAVPKVRGDLAFVPATIGKVTFVLGAKDYTGIKYQPEFGLISLNLLSQPVGPAASTQTMLERNVTSLPTCRRTIRPVEVGVSQSADIDGPLAANFSLSPTPKSALSTSGCAG